ncbi:MAG: ABC transporter ATP-binding protein [Planctomycetes bacterium]|nr:ABC transporter ATP-binding protein [Planctomycetota bacterium]
MSDPIIAVEHLNMWYGRVTALNDVSLTTPPGISGLLGPNGAGKTSFMRILVGLMRPSGGAVTVLGDDPWNNTAHNLRTGYCPEHDGFHEWMSGREFLTWMLRLRGRMREDARHGAAEALDRVRLQDAADRPIGTYSRGMRQRLKIAQAVSHDARLLFLDEPLTGTDPLVRLELIELIRSFGREGRSVLVSSHVLHEIEALTTNIVLFHRGRLVACGDVHEIRSLIDRHPHLVSVRTTRARDLAAALLRDESVSEVSFPRESEILVRTRRPDDFYARLPKVALELECSVEELSSPDDNLEAVFRYLTEK